MGPRLPLSVSRFTFNEEANLPRCLQSLRDLAAQIVVVDSGSTDRTAQIARNAGAVFISEPWQGFIRQKNICLDRCTRPDGPREVKHGLPVGALIGRVLPALPVIHAVVPSLSFFLPPRPLTATMTAEPLEFVVT